MIEVTADQPWTSFDFISSAWMDELSISIDEHPMWIYSVDRRFIEPYMVHAALIDPGARYPMMVQLDKPIEQVVGATPLSRLFHINIGPQPKNRTLPHGTVFSTLDRLL